MRDSRLSRCFVLYLAAAVGAMFLLQAAGPLRSLEFRDPKTAREAALYQAAVNAPEVLGEGKLLDNPAHRPEARFHAFPRHRALSGKGRFTLETRGDYVSAKRRLVRIEQKNYAPIKLLN